MLHRAEDRRGRATVVVLLAVAATIATLAGATTSGAATPAPVASRSPSLRSTLPTSPPIHPVTPGDATVRLTWDPPRSGTAVTGYRVARRAFSPASGTWGAWQTTDLSAGATGHVWSGLTNGRQTQVRVAAQDAGAWGPYSPARTATPSARLIDRGIRSQVRTAYRHRLVPALRVPNRWTGSVAHCRAGTNSAAYRRATRDAVNYMRAMSDVGPVTFARRFNSKAQRAALMMQANGQLSHDPPKTWRCYSAAGHQAAASSNLASGAAGPQAIAMYMSDPGDGNTAAGHRRWITYPRQKVMGTGDTSLANDLWVFGTWARRNPAGTPAYQAWPNAGYFPRELEPGGRWSLTSTRGASFARARVRVVGPGGTPVGLIQYPDAPGYGDNTVVWQLKKVPSRSIAGARRYTVHVTGITSPHGSTVSHVYRITLFSAA